MPPVQKTSDEIIEANRTAARLAEIVADDNLTLIAMYTALLAEAELWKSRVRELEAEEFARGEDDEISL